MTPRVLLTEIGSYASGDEALYIATVRNLVRAGYQVHLASRIPYRGAMVKAGLNVEETLLPLDMLLPPLSAAGDIPRVLRGQFPEMYHRIVGLVETMQAVLVAPGGRFLEQYNTVKAMTTAAVAMERGIPVYHFPQSFGPYPAERDVLLASFLAGAAAIAVRDDHSLAYLRSILPAGKEIIPGRDMIFTEMYPVSKIESFELGLNLRYGFNGHGTLDGIQALVRHYRRERPQDRIAAFTTTHPFPNELTRMLETEGISVYPDTIRYPDYLHLPASCDLVVTESFHGSIFAMLAETPFLMCRPDYDAWKFLGSGSVEGFPEYRGPGDAEQGKALAMVAAKAQCDLDNLRRRQQASLVRNRQAAAAALHTLLDRMPDRVKARAG